MMAALSGALLSTRATESQPRANVSLLSPREHEVLLLLSLAMSNKEIAARLLIAEGTVKRHTGNLYEKLSARSRLDAVMKARLSGLI